MLDRRSSLRPITSRLHVLLQTSSRPQTIWTRVVWASGDATDGLPSTGQYHDDDDDPLYEVLPESDPVSPARPRSDSRSASIDDVDLAIAEEMAALQALKARREVAAARATGRHNGTGVLKQAVFFGGFFGWWRVVEGGKGGRGGLCSSSGVLTQCYPGWCRCRYRSTIDVR